MFNRDARSREWVERPVGWLGRREIQDLILRLQRIPNGRSEVRIEWDEVAHLDFRGLSALASQIRVLRKEGIAVRCTGFNPYIVAILRFALTLDEAELFDARDEGIGGAFWVPSTFPGNESEIARILPPSSLMEN